MTVPARLASLDVVRGAAVMGILLLNILSFGLPGDAYSDPRAWGGDHATNLWTWAIMFVLAEGKMRGLFSMLFGASTILIAERAAAAGLSPARTHYARMTTLAAIGMAHAYLIWSGDILVSYALGGAIVFAAWRLPVAKLAALAGVLLVVQFATGIGIHVAAHHFEQRATAPGASPAVQAEWAEFRASVSPSPESTRADLAAYRGGWREVSDARIATTREDQALMLPATLPETLAMMLLGMALYRGGFLTGGWPTHRYRQVVAWGLGIGLPLYALLAWWIAARAFDPLVLVLADPLHLVLLRPIVALAYAAALILWLRSGHAAGLIARIGAAGRMAFSNYLLTSIVCTLIFYGYGLGWYGRLERWQLYIVVAAIWAGMLGWSQPWLARFAYGPFEWLWRSLARGRIQPFLRRHAASPAN